MRYRFGTAALAALLVGGCNMLPETPTAERDADNRTAERAERNTDTANTSADADTGGKPIGDTAASDDDGATLASTSGTRVTRDWFTGSWTDSGDCAQAGEFGEDGRFVLADGGRGTWNVASERLILQGPGGRVEVGLRKVDDDTVEVINADGSVGRSTRC